MNLLLLGFAREKSERIPTKLISQFANTTLIDIAIDKLEKIQNIDNPFKSIKMGISRVDEILWEKVSNSNVEILERNLYSVTAPANFNLKKAYHFLEDRKEEYIMWFNPCFPFLKPQTIVDVANYFINHKLKGLECAIKKQNWFWDSNKKPINIEPGVLYTQGMKPLYESSQFTHIYNREYMLENGNMFPYTKNNPYIYEVNDSYEFIDIDTQEQFDIAKTLWKNGYR